MRRSILAVLLLPAAVLAQEQARTVAGQWFDDGGNEDSLSAKAIPYDRLQPGMRPVSEVVALFNDACLRVAVGTEAARPAILSRQAWNFRFLDTDSGTGGRLDGWQAIDLSVTSQPRSWPLAECNVLAARSSQDPLESVAAQLSQLLAAQPDKQYRTRSADGRKMQGQTARWSVTGPTGVARRVYASSYSDLNGSYALHLGLTEARNK